MTKSANNHKAAPAAKMAVKSETMAKSGLFAKSGRANDSLLDRQAHRQANNILKALDEANEIHAGRKKETSFSEFLKEI
ncbi:MAG: hypothetical protein ABJB16_17415 [Saprospiraceae bacterium]